MYFSTAVALAALPFLVGAVPAKNSLRDVISIPLSKRSTFRNADGAVDTASLQASIYHTLAKYQRGFEAFERNTGNSHPLAPKLEHSDKRSASIGVSVPLDYRGSMWTGTISVGSPASAFTVLFDTGSADLFLPGTKCTSIGCRHNHTYYPSLSSTAKDQMQSFFLSYSSGIVQGELYTDSVFVGGFEATAQTLGVASKMSYGFCSKYFDADGILGLGFKNISAFHADPFVETVIGQSRLQDSVFGLSLAGPNSTLILGGRDSTLYKGNLTYLVVDTPGYWQTKLDGIAVNGTDVQVSNKHVIIASGITAVVGDHDSIANFYGNIPDSNTTDGLIWTYPCNTMVNASINFGGTTFNISPNTFNLGPTYNKSGRCIGGFVAAPIFPVSNFWVIGDVFLQNVYTEFDVGRLQIGFAPLA